jgi:hypothetical protein
MVAGRGRDTLVRPAHDAFGLVPEWAENGFGFRHERRRFAGDEGTI